jgi:rubrerythrin
MSTESKPLSLEEAIRTAIEYETKVRNMYRDAVELATEEVGKRIFRALAKEEQGHLDYLESRQKEWRETGKVAAIELTTVLPSRERMREGVAQLERSLEGRRDWTVELDLLRKALRLESETGAFYKRMVEELDQEGQQLFGRFLEIEDMHYDLVQSEIDALTNTGFWFDSMEFQIEAG